jgi:hypothetical protein
MKPVIPFQSINDLYGKPYDPATARGMDTEDYSTADIAANYEDSKPHVPFIHDARKAVMDGLGIKEDAHGLVGKWWYGNSSLADPENRKTAQAQSWKDAMHRTMATFTGPELIGSAVDTVQNFNRSKPMTDPKGAGEAAFGAVMGGVVPLGFGAGGALMRPTRGGANSLIGPEGAQRLTMAENPATGQPFRHADDWGGIGRLDRAKAMREAGAGPDHTWQTHGWSDNAFGEKVDWHTAIDDTPMKVNHNAPRTVMAGSRHNRYSKFGDAVDHPEFFAANPGTENGLIKAGQHYDNDRLSGHVGLKSKHEAHSQAAADHYTKVYKDAPFYMEAKSDTLDGLRSGVTHEMSHISADQNRLPSGTNDVAAPIVRDTPRYMELERLASSADLERIGRDGGYVNDIGEKIARADQAVLDDPGKHPLGYKTPRQHDYIDVYSPTPVSNPFGDIRDLVPRSLDPHRR